MLYISVDVEASGVIPAVFNLVSVGATAVTEAEGAFEIGEDFYVELKPEFDGFSAEAMAVHGIPREHLEKNGIPAREAMGRFADWVHEHHDGKPPRPVFVGHNAAFDWAFINFTFHHTGVKNPFNIFPLDIKALATGTLRIPWARARKSYLKDALGVGEIDETLRHRADYDARYQAKMFVALMNRVFKGQSTRPLPEEISPED
jgi:DNA polymerase III epsilon subunit-like protein